MGKGYTGRKIILSHGYNSLVGCLAIRFGQNPLSTKVESGIDKPKPDQVEAID